MKMIMNVNSVVTQKLEHAPVAVSNLCFKEPSLIILICCGLLITFLFHIDATSYCENDNHCSEEYSICDHDNNRCTGGGE